MEVSKTLNSENSLAAKTLREASSELKERRWSVISFDRTEAISLSYAEAVSKMTGLEAAGVNGLCIVTDEAAARVKTV